MTLLELGADHAAAATDGRTPLHAACAGGFEVPPPGRPPFAAAAGADLPLESLIPSAFSTAQRAC